MINIVQLHTLLYVIRIRACTNTPLFIQARMPVNMYKLAPITTEPPGQDKFPRYLNRSCKHVLNILNLNPNPETSATYDSMMVVCLPAAPDQFLVFFNLLLSMPISRIM